MNFYRISYTDFDQVNAAGRKGVRVECGTFEARNAIEAIKTCLRSKGISDEDIATGRSVGSTKRLTLAGITFQGDKVRS